MGKVKNGFLIVLFLVLGTSHLSAQDVPAAERQALIDLYNATNGPNWTNATNWNTVALVEDWFGVTVVDGKVTAVQLGNNNLSGSLPSTLGNLGDLVTLRLHSNSLTGSIPATLGNLAQLRTLYCRINQLSGTIPSELGNLTQLQILDFSSNQLSGFLPLEYGNLGNLRGLELNNNQFTGTIPATYGGLSNLRELKLSQNQLEGTIPPELGNLASLEQLWLQNNLLTGAIPTSLGTSGNVLDDLSLSNNALTGNIPPELANLTNLRYLTMTNNELSGSIPAGLAGLTNYVTVNFGGNILSGDIPSFTNAPSMSYFSIADNAFVFSDFENDYPYYDNNVNNFLDSPQAKVDLEETLSVPENGSITLTSNVLTSPNNTYQWFKDGQPIAGAMAKDLVIDPATPADAGTYHFLANNTVITGLELERNPITLTVTADTCGVSDTEKQALLDLYNSTNGDNWTNTLAGNQPWDTNIPVCDWYGVTVVDGSVTVLEILNNGLVGRLPESIGDLIYLERLRLVNENWGGSSIPSSIGNLTALRYLQIGGGSNGLGGSIPPEIGNLSNLVTLNLSINDLSGPIPSTIGNLTNLVNLEAHSNNLESIPNTIGNMTSLVNIYLQGNNISGTIPAEIGQLSNLQRLVLGSNNLSGTIPPELGNLNNLIWLHLYRNQLQGELPVELGNLVNLGVFYVYGNNLTGNIPSSYGNWSIIRTIGIQENSFSGPLPASWATRTGLTRLSFDNNNFIFSDVEADHPSYVTNATALYEYSPQAKVDLEESLSVPENGSITLTSNVLTSPNNTYQWFKDGQPIVGATSKDLVIDAATSEDVGVYHFEAVNSVVTGLTLTRNDITLSIGAPLCDVSESERQALLDLYAATNGDNWTNTLVPDQPWDPNTSVCDWFGVTVENGTITQLELPDNLLVGNLPESIGNLLSVTILNLGGNDLTGEIPSSIGSLLELETLLLPNNNLIGELPPSLGSLSDLVTLDLSNNQLQSQIPISFCNLAKITDLNLSFNGLFGSVPREIELMASLVRLNLSHNELSGQLPSSIANLSNLQEVLINDNQLEDFIYFTASAGSALNRFNFENNKYIFSDFVSKHTGYLQYLNNGYTYSPQAKTDNVETKSVTLGNDIILTTELSSDNNVYEWYKDDVLILDAITNELVIENATTEDAGIYYFKATNTDIEGLELERNPITLNVLTSCDLPLAERQALIDLYNATGGPNWTNTQQSNQIWAVNDVNSLVCDWYGVTVENNTVTRITLSNNGLEGTLPNVFSAFQALTTLNVSSNKLTGAITDLFDTNTSLMMLALQDNEYIFNDLERDHLELVQRLMYGFTSSPQAKVDIPETLNIQLGSSITLSSNVLVNANNTYQWFKNGLPIAGETSKDLVLTNITAADAGGYHFEAINVNVSGLTLEREMVMLNVNGDPDSCGVSDVERQALLALYNATDGANWTNNENWNTNAPVCDWFGVVTDQEARVIGLELPANNLRGEIPLDIIGLANIKTINLSQNSLIGELPQTIGNLIYLETLLLNNNILVGEIPEMIGNASALITLNLGFNRFSGSIPQSIGNLQQLQTLDLNDNKLRQGIPSGLWTIGGLVHINLSNNELSGGISSNIVNLAVLQEFWLSNNNFSGTIPATITNIPVLRSVRLNDNLFSGDIPLLIPDFNVPNTEVAIENNAFVFSDFEDEYPNYSTQLDVFTYNPQADVDRREVIPVFENDQIVLGTEDLSSPNNTYIWYKDGSVIEGVTGSSYTITGFDPAQHIGDYWFVASNNVIPVLELTRRKITLTERLLNGDECDVLLDNVADGTFESCLDEINANNGFREGGVACSNWVGIEVARLSEVFSRSSVYLAPIPGLDIGQSPDGGVFLANLVSLHPDGQGLNISSDYFRTGLENLELGTRYVVQFYQANGTNFSEKNTEEDYGGWQVTFGAETKLSNPSYVGELPRWTLKELSFEATQENVLLEFRAYANHTGEELDSDGRQPAREIMIDGIKVFKVGGVCTVPDSVQDLCSTGETLTVADLAPVDTSAAPLWYTTETGGTALDETTPLQDGTYWQDIDDGQGLVERLEVAVTVDKDAPTGDAVQSFDFQGGETPAVGWLEAQPSEGRATINWFDSPTSTVILDLRAPLEIGQSYYALQENGQCRLMVTVEDIQLTGDECDVLASSLADGSFEECLDEIQAGGDGQSLDCSGWTLNLPRQDPSEQPFVLVSPIDAGIRINMNLEVVESPSGGVMNAAQVFLQDGKASPDIEVGGGGFNTTINNLTVGVTYIIEFYEANASDPSQMITYGEMGGWQVRFGDQTQLSQGARIFQIPGWNKVTMGFIATSQSQILEFNPYSNYAGSPFDSNIRNPRKVMLIDGIKVFEVGTECIDQEECIDTLTSIADGSFETAIGALDSGRNGSLEGSQWIVRQGTPDTFAAPYYNTEDNFVRADFGNSPNGGNGAGALRVGDTTESFYTTMTGLTAGTTYIVEFYQANATNLVKSNLTEEAYGFWEVSFDRIPLNSRRINPGSKTGWQREQLEYVAPRSSGQLEFTVKSSASDANNAYPVYMLIDGIRVYAKPENNYTTECADINTQVFCNIEEDNEPTIADLVSPTAGSVIWYSDQVGGTRYFAEDPLFELPSYFIWADDGSGDPRIAVEIVFGLGAPEGEEFQFFDAMATAPTLNNLQVEGTGITWHDSFTSGTVLSSSTPLVNGVTYYAAQNGNACRLPVEVGIGIPEPTGSQFQEFCSTANPTIGDLVMGTTDLNYTIQWYTAETEGTIYNSIDPLVDGTTYYAAQTDGVNFNENRVPVTVRIIDVVTQGRTYEQDIETPLGSTFADLTDFFLLDAAALWYDDPFAGNAYSNTATLIDGETYYTRIGNNGLCETLEVLAITVTIAEVEEPELITCIKFIPQPNDRYVISGWVREDKIVAEQSGTRDFNEVKDVFIELLDHLTAKVLNKEEIPPVYKPMSDPLAPNMDALLPFIKNRTDKNLTVYNFEFETEVVGGVEKSIGFSFSLDEGNVYRFVYTTPLIEVDFSGIFGTSLDPLTSRYHFPIKNYEGLQITYTDVAVDADNTFRITADFSVETAEGSYYRTTYPNQVTNSSTDSGIEENIPVFSYSEDPGYMVMDYVNSRIELSYTDEDGADIPQDATNAIFEPKGAVIDGWQRISSAFTIPNNAAYMKITLRNEGDELNAYFDDVRIHPFDSNMKSFVYDPITQRLQAELDENNYATFYEYDTEGGLVRVKKETERGVYTIQETRSGNSKLNGTE